MKRLLILVISAIFTFYIHGEDVQKSFLFINSTPIRAKVIVDGIDKGLLTPCVLRDISSYQTVILKKTGYKDTTIKLTNITTEKINITLPPKSFDLYFPERYLYKIGNAEIQGPVYVSGLIDGNYDIKFINNKISFGKISPFVPAEISLGTSLGISTALMFTTIGLAEYYGWMADSSTTDFDQRHYSQVKDGLDLAKYSAISITSVLALALSAVAISDASIRYYNKKQKIKIEDKAPQDHGKSLYDTSLQFLSMGEIEKSLKILQSLLSVYTESDYIPIVYYQLGQNYYILQDYDNALKYYETFINEYPIAKYYDYVLKNIAEIHYMRKNYHTALKTLNKAVFTRDILTNESIFSLKAKLNFTLWEAEKTEEYFTACENDLKTLINNFETPDKLDFYYLQLIRLYNLTDNAEKLINLKEKAAEIEEPSLRELILSYFNE